jgi:hypothetical protein
MERELVSVEQARAVAAVQQEAHRIASRLDDNVTTQHNEQAAQAAAAEQVGLLACLVMMCVGQWAVGSGQWPQRNKVVRAASTEHR